QGIRRRRGAVKQVRDFVEGNLRGADRSKHSLRPIVFRRQDLCSDATSRDVVPSEEVCESTSDVDADTPHGSLLARGAWTLPRCLRVHNRTRTTIPLSTRML